MLGLESERVGVCWSQLFGMRELGIYDLLSGEYEGRGYQDVNFGENVFLGRVIVVKV